MTPQVPVLDLGRWAAHPDSFAAQAGTAWREFGFCGFRNHGIGQRRIDDAYAAFRDFFALPEPTRMRYRSVAGGQRGYTPFGVEQARDGAVPDLKEFWHVGREMAAENPWPDVLLPNRWPEELPDFRARALALFRALDALSATLLQIIARHLGLDPHWFDRSLRYGNSILRAIHYPPIADPDTPAVRAARHEDINLITLLIGAEEAGLEILSRDGQWVPVTGIEGTIVVNIGDMMQRLTNHVLPSTPHRVVNPPGAAARRSRYSIPFFVHPEPGFLIRTLPACISAANPDRYPEPITANEFLEQRLGEIGLM